MYKIISTSKLEIDEEGNPLYWNNDIGWVDKESATIFTEEQRNSLNLPLESDWEDILK